MGRRRGGSAVRHREVFDYYRKGGSDTEFHEFEGSGHSLTVDNGWRDVADVAPEWLNGKGF